MGFNEAMTKKVYLFLKPRTIDEAIELMSEADGIYQHDFIESRKTSNLYLCYICKKERKFHRDYIGDDNEKIDNSSVRTNSIIEVKDNRENNNSSELCTICFDTINVSTGNKLPCGHFCCETCLFQYLKTEIESAKVAKLQCFVRDCDYLLTEDFILSKLKDDQKLIDKYKIFKQRANIFLDKDKKFCPEPDCNSYLQKGANKYVQCENGHKYCYVCLKLWHGKTNCDEELDKDFQIWKKDKVVKQCPRCKIYTEKNEGCNHMTCTECKFQWCWLCEGEYNENHFSTGSCNGLQFAKINYLSEKDRVRPYQPYRLNHIARQERQRPANPWAEPPRNDEDMYDNPRYVIETHHRDEDRKKGCCLCNDNITDKFWMLAHNGVCSLYYGNSFITIVVTLLSFVFLFVPLATITIFYELPDRKARVNFNRIVRIITILLSITLGICYSIPITCILLTAVIIATPIVPINPCKIVYKYKEHGDIYV